MIPANSFEYSRAVRAAQRVLACRRAALEVEPISTASSDLLKIGAAGYEQIVIDYANLAIFDARRLALCRGGLQ